jgi:hypothetical protein
MHQKQNPQFIHQNPAVFQPSIASAFVPAGGYASLFKVLPAKMMLA